MGGTEPATEVTCSDRKRTGVSLCGMMPSQLSHTSQSRTQTYYLTDVEIRNLKIKHWQGCVLSGGSGENSVSEHLPACRGCSIFKAGSADSPDLSFALTSAAIIILLL